jgi:hypothetical protein
VDSAWRMLKAGRFDVLLDNKANADQMLNSGAIKTSKYKTYTARTRDLSVYFGKKFLAGHPGLLGRFNTSAKACGKKG